MLIASAYENGKRKYFLRIANSAVKPIKYFNWGVQNVLPKIRKYEIQRKEIILLIEERNTFASNEKSDSVVNTRANQEHAPTKNNEEEFCCQQREQEKGGGEQCLAFRGISFRDGTGFKSNPRILGFYGTGLARYFTHI